MVNVYMKFKKGKIQNETDLCIKVKRAVKKSDEFKYIRNNRIETCDYSKESMHPVADNKPTIRDIEAWLDAWLSRHFDPKTKTKSEIKKLAKAIREYTDSEIFNTTDSETLEEKEAILALLKTINFHIKEK